MSKFIGVRLEDEELELLSFFRNKSNGVRYALSVLKALLEYDGNLDCLYLALIHNDKEDEVKIFKKLKQKIGKEKTL